MNKSECISIDETQRKVNEMMGISDEDFFKHNKSNITAHKHGQDAMVMSACINIPLHDALQHMVNKMFGISEQESAIREASLIKRDKSLISETQKKVNSMMGIDDATFSKYNK